MTVNYSRRSGSSSSITGYNILQVVTAHADLNGVDRVRCHYRMLQLVCKWPDYGVEYHVVRDEASSQLNMGVGPEGIHVYTSDWQPLTR